MDAFKVGKAISYLRKKIGYTQKELADRIGVSDKAVSKWERGLGLPDTSIIGKIAILLDTDTDSLLAGDLVHHNNEWGGLLILNNTSQEINVGTIIYDKPIVYFLLSYFILMGIRDIHVVSGKKDQDYIKSNFENGKHLGINLSYSDELPIEKYRNNLENVMVIFGMSFIYGVDQTRFFQKAMMEKERITILSLPKKKRSYYSRIYYNLDRKVVASGDGEKLRTQYDYYQIPILFCPARVINDMKWDEQENIFSPKKEFAEIYTVVLDRGFVEIPLDSWENVMDAALLVKAVQKACGMQIYCIEEIAWRRGMISHEELYRMGMDKKDSPYGKYILDIAKSDWYK